MKRLSKALVFTLISLATGLVGFSQTQRCSPADPAANIWSVSNGNWSDPATWNMGRVPAEADVVQIGRPGAAHTVVVDTSATVAQTVVCNGTLRFARDAYLTFTTDFLGVQSNGTLDMGTEASPITADVTLRLRGKTPYEYNCPDTHAYCPQDLGLQVARGGRWTAHGKRLALGPDAEDVRTFSELSETAMPGATSIVVAERVDLAGWEVGKKIAIAQTETTTECNSACDGASCGEDAAPNTLQDQNEVRTIRRLAPLVDGSVRIDIAPALNFKHEVGPFDEEDGLYRQSHVIYLERNVKIRSIDFTNRPSHVLILEYAQPPRLKFVEFLELGSKVRTSGCNGSGCEPNRYPTHNHASDGVFEGLSYHRSKRAHLVLHRGGRNAVSHNTFYDEFAFQGASIWVANPSGETHVSVDNVISHNVMLLSPRFCILAEGGDLRIEPPTPLLAGLLLQHPTQSINSNVVSGGTYGYWLMFDAPGADTAPINSFDGNISYVGIAGLTHDSVPLEGGTPKPYRPSAEQEITNFKIWGYIRNVMSFDTHNVVWKNFKLFDSIGAIPFGTTTAGAFGETDSGTLQIDSADGNNTLETATLRNAVVKGGPLTDQLLFIGGDRLIVDAEEGERWKFQGDVSATVILLTRGEAQNPDAPPAIGKFDFGPDGKRGYLMVNSQCDIYPVLAFTETLQPGTKGTFCTTALKSCDPSIRGATFTVTPGDPNYPDFSPNGMLTPTTCSEE